MPRKKYKDSIEVVPGVFVAPDALYIVDDQGEVCMWNIDEVSEEDNNAFTAAINAVAIAAKYGANKCRKVLKDQKLFNEILEETRQITN